MIFPATIYVYFSSLVSQFDTHVPIFNEGPFYSLKHFKIIIVYFKISFHLQMSTHAEETSILKRI